jgi:hypothetical protein
MGRKQKNGVKVDRRSKEAKKIEDATGIDGG